MRGVAVCPPGLLSVSGETSRRWLRAPELRDSLTQGSPQPRGGLASPDQPGCPSPFTVPGIKALALTGQLPPTCLHPDRERQRLVPTRACSTALNGLQILEPDCHPAVPSGH